VIQGGAVRVEAGTTEAAMPEARMPEQTR